MQQQHQLNNAWCHRSVDNRGRSRDGEDGSSQGDESSEEGGDGVEVRGEDKRALWSLV